MDLEYKLLNKIDLGNLYIHFLKKNYYNWLYILSKSSMEAKTE